MEALVVVLVILLFRSLDRRTASMVATGMFLLLPTLFLVLEARQVRRDGLKVWSRSFPRIFATLMHAQFLILFALPIFYLNFIATGAAMSPPAVMGLTMQEFHRYSNFSYMAMAVSSFIGSYWESRRESR